MVYLSAAEANDLGWSGATGETTAEAGGVGGTVPAEIRDRRIELGMDGRIAGGTEQVRQRQRHTQRQRERERDVGATLQEIDPASVPTVSASQLPHHRRLPAASSCCSQQRMMVTLLLMNIHIRAHP